MNLRILIIEDDPENREGLRILISRHSPRSQVFYAAIPGFTQPDSCGGRAGQGGAKHQSGHRREPAARTRTLARYRTR